MPKALLERENKREFQVHLPLGLDNLYLKSGSFWLIFAGLNESKLGEKETVVEILRNLLVVKTKAEISSAK